MKYWLLPSMLAVVSLSAYSDSSKDWVPVGEVRSNNQQQAPANSALYQELLLQNETMQQEIAELRSKVEEQEHMLTQMKTQQQQRYLDLDKRLSALAKGQGTIKPLPPRGGNKTSKRKNSDKLSADDLYDQAMASIKARDFDAAIEDFNLFQKKYAKHNLLPNVLYWVGEAHYSKQETDSAEASFTEVAKRFPKHNKTPGAQYKLALIKARKGNTKEAKALLEKVIANKETSALVLRQAKKQLSKY